MLSYTGVIDFHNGPVFLAHHNLRHYSQIHVQYNTMQRSSWCTPTVRLEQWCIPQL